MRAIAYRRNVETGESNKLENIKQPLPKPQGYDILIEVKAVSVNPVDKKVWKKFVPQGDEYKVLGYDAAGVVVAVGDMVTMFKPEDEVWCAGDITRPGTFEKFHLADQRLVAHKPTTLSFAEAAALPLTSLTAWELLFDRMHVPQGDDSKGKTVLVIGAAGGVGSVMVQLLKHKTACTVIATAGSEASKQWLLNFGVDHVIDYNQPLSEGVKALGIPYADYVVSLTHTDQYLAEIAKVIAPEGHFGLIDDPEQLDIRLFKQKSIQINWEYMFTRSLFQLPNMIKQHNILQEVAQLVDEGKIKTTMSERLYPICAENIHRAFEHIKQHSVRGKIVLEGW
ncbi:MAG: zinc-binding alcohol dehydrogenase family protein [Tannerellaceae bacterium]